MKNSENYEHLLALIKSIQQKINGFKSSTELEKARRRLVEHCQRIRNQVEIHDDQQAMCEPCANALPKNYTKMDLIKLIDIYERKCLDNLQQRSIQKEYILIRFTECNEQLQRLKIGLDRKNPSEQQLRRVYAQVRQMECELDNGETFHDSLVYLGQLLVYKNVHDTDDIAKKCKAKQLKYDEFTYANILNIERLNGNFKRSDISYVELCAHIQTVMSIWLALFTQERLVICLHVYDEQLKHDKVSIRINDSNGMVVRDRPDFVHFKMLTMTTSDRCILIVLQSTRAWQPSDGYKMELFDLDLNCIQTVQIAYEPILVSVNTCNTYTLSRESPFVHVYDETLALDYEFGQMIDDKAPFYMPDPIQFHIYDDKIYYRNVDNTFIKVLSLENGYLLKSIGINLVDCLLHIDSIGRIIVVNQDNKILYLYNDDGQIIFEYDLTYVQYVDSFCIINNGHLLINDSANKVLHIA